MTATHKALQIVEISKLVFEYLDHDRTLSAVAVACKVFKNPALDILWRYMDDLLPLLSILPLKKTFPAIVRTYSTVCFLCLC
jgi:hypothetical protein